MKKNFLAASLKLSAIMVVLAVTGCAEYHRRVLTHTKDSGSEFHQTLAKEYEALGSIEQNIMYDECSANYFYCKALHAKHGRTVYPAKLENWDIEYEKIPELAMARARLMRALNAGARERAPKMTAYAQAHFDCWTEQQAEGWQKIDIARCRSEFYTAMAEVELMLMGGVEDVMPTDMILFPFNSSHITKEGMRRVERITEMLKSQNEDLHILLVGRTDQIGEAKYNKNLSRQRALAVKKLLIRKDIAAHHISVKAAGETPGPHVDAHNRRVDIILLKSM